MYSRIKSKWENYLEIKEKKKTKRGEKMKNSPPQEFAPLENENL